MRALAKDPRSRFADITAFASAFEQASQQNRTRKLPAKHGGSLRSSLQIQGLVWTPPASVHAHEMDRAVKSSPFAAGSINSPSAAVLSRQEQAPSRCSSPAGMRILQGLGRHRLAGRTVAMLLALLMLISVGGLYAAIRIAFVHSYAGFVATSGIMFGFDAQRTHANPYEQILNPLTVAGLTKQWAYQTGNIIDSSPAVAGGVVYVGSDDDDVYALDTASGRKHWSYRTGNMIASSPAVASGVVYIGSSDVSLYALDAASGAKKWAYHTGSAISFSSPVVVSGVVYIGSGDGYLYALDAASGAKKWVYRTGGHIFSSPAVAGGVVYIGSLESYLYALDVASGAKKWIYRTRIYIGFSAPAVANGAVYVGSDDHNLYAFHLPGT